MTGWQWHQLANMQIISTMPAPHHSIFTGQALFLMPNQQFLYTKGFSKN